MALSSPAESRLVRPAPPKAALSGDETVALWLMGIALLVRIYIPTSIVDLFWSYSTTGGSNFEKIHPGSYLLFAVSGLTFFLFGNRKTGPEAKVAAASWRLITVILLIAAFGLLTDHSQGFSYLMDSLLVGPVLCAALLLFSDEARYRLLVLMIYCLFLNNVVALWEFASESRLMPYIYHEPFFRPTAFLGHPLMNGLANVLAIPFVWLARWSSLRRLSVMVFFMAVSFADGARMASIFSVLALITCSWVALGRSARRGEIDEGTLITTAMAFLSAILIATTLVVISGLAERLVGTGIFQDDSSQSRFLIYQILGYMDLNQLLFGISREWATYLTTQVLNLPRSESPIVDYVVQFGIVGAVLLTGALAQFFWASARNSRNAFAIIGTMVFVATAATNNTFSGKGPHMVLYVVFAISALQASRGYFTAPSGKQRRNGVPQRPMPPLRA